MTDAAIPLTDSVDAARKAFVAATHKRDVLVALQDKNLAAMKKKHKADRKLANSAVAKARNALGTLSGELAIQQAEAKPADTPE